MNLAEFPLTVLSKRADQAVKTLEFKDTVKGKNGETINRAWIITGADKFGLPTASDDEVLIGLLKLTADDGLQNRKVSFTRYELLKILRWTTEGRSYTRLQNALDRLSGVRIKATNAFYDNDTKLHSTRNFGIIDAYEINDGRDTRPSFFIWSDVIFKSFQVGFIKKLDLTLYLDLRSAVSKRLYRYLDKHFWYRSKIVINLFTLAHEKVGISRNYVYASSLRQQLEPAFDELIEKGMLAEYSFSGKGSATEVTMLAANGARKTTPAAIATSGPPSAVLATRENIGTDTRPLSPERERLIEQLTARGLSEKQMRKIISLTSPEMFARLDRIIQYFDGLVESKSHLVNKNPCGFLYRAIERPQQFVLPEDRTSEARRPAMQSQTAQAQMSFNLQATNPRPETREQRARETEVLYLTEKSKVLEKVLRDTDEREKEKLSAEIAKSLVKMREHLSPDRFRQVVKHAVEERLLERAGFADFASWQRRHKR